MQCILAYKSWQVFSFQSVAKRIFRFHNPCLFPCVAYVLVSRHLKSKLTRCKVLQHFVQRERTNERKKEGDEAETKESGIKREIGLSVSHQQQVSHPLSLYVSLTIFSLSLSRSVEDHTELSFPIFRFVVWTDMNLWVLSWTTDMVYKASKCGWVSYRHC